MYTKEPMRYKEREAMFIKPACVPCTSFPHVDLRPYVYIYYTHNTLVKYKEYIDSWVRIRVCVCVCEFDNLFFL